MQLMKVTTRNIDPHLIVELNGELNLYYVGDLRKQILEILNDAPASQTSLVVDCKGLTYLDSSGIGLFIQLMRRQRSESGRQFHIVGLNQKLLDTFRGANLHHYFQFADSVELIAEAAAS